jgi:uncharacterized protein
MIDPVELNLARRFRLPKSLEIGGWRPAFRLVLLLAPLLTIGAEAQSQQATPGTPASPAAGAGAASQGAPASATQLALGRRLVVASGMSRSFTIIIPQFMDQIATGLAQTRPELIRDLNTVLSDLKPEFDKQADEMIDTAAQIYAKRLSEQDLKAAVGFFESSAGKQYVETQPAFLGDVVAAMQAWQGKISTNMMTRVRTEMKQKGHEL